MMTAYCLVATETFEALVKQHGIIEFAVDDREPVTIERSAPNLDGSHAYWVCREGHKLATVYSATEALAIVENAQ